MGDKTGIEWTQATWNPIRGCSRMSAGCQHCYAETMAARFSGKGMPYEGLTKDGKWTGKIKVVESAMDQPIRWKKPRRIFVNSMSDLFHDSLAFDDVERIFRVMAQSPQHTFQVLTKRPENMLKGVTEIYAGQGMTEPLPNVWLGISAENQETYNERVPFLLQTPATVRFLSCEPLLGPIDLKLLDMYGDRRAIDWVIAGGESGHEARLMKTDWARSLRDQCAVAEVPYFFKQYGEFRVMDNGMTTKGKHANGSELDGREHKEFPR